MPNQRIREAIEYKYGVGIEIITPKKMAEELGISVVKFNNLLEEKGIIRRERNSHNGFVYFLTSKYENLGLVYVNEDNENYSDRLMYTLKGRDFILTQKL